jgi:GH24 family phage-related lysozyme (muramidase)
MARVQTETVDVVDVTFNLGAGCLQMSTLPGLVARRGAENALM